jgi:hypothetical protein
MGSIAPISSNHLLEIASNEKLFTDILDVSGAGTAGGLTLSSVDKRMREVILKHSFFQRRVLARALTARAFRLSGASICAPLKIGEATRESFDTAARFALKFHRDRYQPLILEAQTAQRAFDDIVGRFFHTLSVVDKSLVPPILKHITALKKPTPYIHIAHAIAKRSDPTATQDASNWLQYEGSYLEECVEIACAQALKSDLNALQDAVTFFGLEDIQHEDLYEARLDVDIRKVINEYETSKAAGKEVKPLIQSAQNLLKVYDSRPCKIFIELGRCQLREDAPNCVENTLAILNLDKNHKAYYLSEIIDKSYRLKKNIHEACSLQPRSSLIICMHTG